MAMFERNHIFQLPGGYSLRKSDEDTWWLQVLGMDILAIESSVPNGPGGSNDAEMKRFADAMNAGRAALAEKEG